MALPVRCASAAVIRRTAATAAAADPKVSGVRHEIDLLLAREPGSLPARALGAVGALPPGGARADAADAAWRRPEPRERLRVARRLVPRGRRAPGGALPR